MLGSFGTTHFEVQGLGPLWISGNCTELGNWDTNKALELKNEPKGSLTWVGTAWLPTGRTIEWKMCSKYDTVKVKWEEKIENHELYLIPGKNYTTKATWEIQIEENIETEGRSTI